MFLPAPINKRFQMAYVFSKGFYSFLHRLEMSFGAGPTTNLLAIGALCQVHMSKAKISVWQKTHLAFASMIEARFTTWLGAVTLDLSVSSVSSYIFQIGKGNRLMTTNRTSLRDVGTLSASTLRSQSPRRPDILHIAVVDTRAWLMEGSSARIYSLCTEPTREALSQGQ